MIMESTSRDKIERRLVIQEPTPSIPAIGQSIIVAAQARVRSPNQSVRSAEGALFASTEKEK
jgi:hypothetical protein